MNARSPAYQASPSIAAQIVRLPDLAMAEIKTLWRQLFENETPTHNRQFLERRIAYKLQEIESRKVAPGLLEKNKQRIASLIEFSETKKRERDYQTVPGTVFTREYRGITYQVIATADGQYEFEGRPYRSLSVIAREITGTRWSGPLFFGLKPPPAIPKKKGGRR